MQRDMPRFAGLALLLPPVASIFAIDLHIWSIPFTAIYLFGVWALLIIGAALLSRGLNRQHEEESAEAGERSD